MKIGKPMGIESRSTRERVHLLMMEDAYVQELPKEEMANGMVRLTVIMMQCIPPWIVIIESNVRLHGSVNSANDIGK